MQVWKEHGKETFESPNIVTLKGYMTDIKKQLRKIFDKYSKYCTACDGDCCHVIFGGFSGAEIASMSLENRMLLGRLMVKPKKEIEKLIKKNKCMYHGEEVGCKLPWQMRSVICTNFICPIFRNVLEAKDREKINKYSEDLDKMHEQLIEMVNAKRKNDLKW
jgi:hypothetical protein